MKIDNEKNYETGGWAFSEIGLPIMTSLGLTTVVSNYHGLYGVVASDLMILVTDNWSVANSYMVSLPGPRKEATHAD